MKGSGATNFKINSKGQLRHFNCTIPGRIENVEQRRGGKARSKKEKRGDREEAGRQAGRQVMVAEKAKEEKDGQRGGAAVGMDGHKK